MKTQGHSQSSPAGIGFPGQADEIDDWIARPNQRSVDALRRRPGPILVLGAGGKMGLHLAVMLRRALQMLGRDDRVLAVSRFRTLRDREEFARFGVETFSCDLENPVELSQLPSAPTIFFLAGVKFGTAGAPDLLRRVNAEMPRRVAARFPRSTFAAFSTGCIYPFVTPESGGATEDTPPAPSGEYAASCLARENAFEEAARCFSLKSVLIRLNYSVEFRYGLLVDIALKVYRAEPIDVTMGYANAIWQTDALNYAIQSLELASAPPTPINITGAALFSIREIAQRFGEIFNRPPQFVGVEAETAWLNNPARSHRQFGPPVTSLDTMITWIAKWLSSGGVVWNKPTGFERRDGRY